jgi:hypothetical protein
MLLIKRFNFVIKSCYCHTSAQLRLTYAKEGKRGHIESTHLHLHLHLPLLERVNISPENWLKLTTQFTRVFHGAVGRPSLQVSYCENLNRERRVNSSNCEKLLA